MTATHELAGFTYAYVGGAADSPALLLLHGTGGDEHDLVPIGTHISPTATIVSPRGRAPEGPVNRWCARHAPGVLDEEDIVRRAAELATFLDEVRTAHRIEQPLWALGYSNGANMAAAMMLLHPGSLDGALLLRPMLPLRPERTPDLQGVPIYIAAGTRDTMIPAESTGELIALLEESGADTTASWTDAGHGFSREELEAARKWLENRAE